MNEKKLKTYKRINREAEIFGFPFVIFFALLLFTIISFLIMYSGGFIVGVLWAIIYLSAISGFWYVYKKRGLKESMKALELFFRNPEVIKIKGKIKPRKTDFDL